MIIKTGMMMMVVMVVMVVIMVVIMRVIIAVFRMMIMTVIIMMMITIMMTILCHKFAKYSWSYIITIHEKTVSMNSVCPSIDQNCIYVSISYMIILTSTLQEGRAVSPVLMKD